MEFLAVSSDRDSHLKSGTRARINAFSDVRRLRAGRARVVDDYRTVALRRAVLKRWWTKAFDPPSSCRFLHSNS